MWQLDRVTSNQSYAMIDCTNCTKYRVVPTTASGQYLTVNQQKIRPTIKRLDAFIVNTPTAELLLYLSPVLSLHHRAHRKNDPEICQDEGLLVDKHRQLHQGEDQEGGYGGQDRVQEKPGEADQAVP